MLNICKLTLRIYKLELFSIKPGFHLNESGRFDRIRPAVDRAAHAQNVQGGLPFDRCRSNSIDRKVKMSWTFSVDRIRSTTVNQSESRPCFFSQSKLHASSGRIRPARLSGNYRRRSTAGRQRVEFDRIDRFRLSGNPALQIQNGSAWFSSKNKPIISFAVKEQRNQIVTLI